jgi:ElaB/YqjD/DUF883 family membrane-anchored ribosome-binding protein
LLCLFDVRLGVHRPFPSPEEFKVQPTNSDGPGTSAPDTTCLSEANAEASEIGQKASDAAHRAADAVGTAADYVHDNSRSMLAHIQRIVKNNPGPALLTAAALGFLIARTFSRD